MTQSYLLRDENKFDEALQAWRRADQAATNERERAFDTARIAVLEGHTDGLFSCSSENLPKALIQLFQGANTGKMMVKV